jgi:hypothetical protein
LIMAVFAVGACGNPAHVVTASPTRRVMENFLTVWLVDRRLDQAEKFLAADFFLPASSDNPELWPDGLGQLLPRERALRFPFKCPGFPVSCLHLADCIRPPTDPSDQELFEMEEILITESLAQDEPRYSRLVGERVVLSIFVLNGCNVGGTVIATRGGSPTGRIISIMYIAG